jgi:hypothetical protein
MFKNVIFTPIWAYDQILLLSDSCGLVDVGHSLWREDGSAVYKCCWCSPVPQDSWPHFTVSDSRLSQPPRLTSPYLYTPGTGWPTYTPGTGFPFRRFLRLARLWWRYSNLPPSGVLYLGSRSYRFVGSVESDLGSRRGCVVSFALQLFHFPLNTTQIRPRTPVRKW